MTYKTYEFTYFHGLSGSHPHAWQLYGRYGKVRVLRGIPKHLAISRWESPCPWRSCT